MSTKAQGIAMNAVNEAREDGMRALAARLETHLLAGDLESVMRLVGRINNTHGNQRIGPLR